MSCSEYVRHVHAWMTFLSSELRIPTTHPCLSLLHLNHHMFPNKAPYAMPGTGKAVSSQGPKSRMYSHSNLEILRQSNGYRGLG
jgi:hypothetical protein